jgi:CHASE2 domain-containing sensor protein
MGYHVLRENQRKQTCDSVGAVVGAAAGGVTGAIVGPTNAITVGVTVAGSSASAACGQFAPLCFIAAGLIGGAVVGATVDSLNCSSK